MSTSADANIPSVGLVRMLPRGEFSLKLTAQQAVVVGAACVEFMGADGKEPLVALAEALLQNAVVMGLNIEDLDAQLRSVIRGAVMAIKDGK